MKRISDDTYSYWASCISAGRPHAVEAMQELCGPLTWYVPEGQIERYLAAGAEECKDSASLVHARNRALADAWARDLTCLQLSDDLKKVAQLAGGKAEPISWEDFLQEFLDSAYWSPFKLSGIAPTDNPFYASDKTQTHHFIVGDCILVAKCDLLFDPAFLLKEDYDYTCAHYMTYGGALRVPRLLASFEHRTNPGGAVAVRTPELEQQMIGLLKSKWPQWIVDNPKRPNEVLLKLPKRKREVLT